jgi:hypothetical protein
LRVMLTFMPVLSWNVFATNWHQSSCALQYNVSFAALAIDVEIVKIAAAAHSNCVVFFMKSSQTTKW